MTSYSFGVRVSPGRLCVTGEVDLTAAEVLLEAILSAGLTGDDPTIVVDLSQVTFLDSSALKALIEGSKRLAAAGVDLRVDAPSPFVARTLEVSGVSEFLGLESMN